MTRRMEYWLVVVSLTIACILASVLDFQIHSTQNQVNQAVRETEIGFIKDHLLRSQTNMAWHGISAEQCQRIYRVAARESISPEFLATVYEVENAAKGDETAVHGIDESIQASYGDPLDWPFAETARLAKIVAFDMCMEPDYFPGFASRFGKRYNVSASKKEAVSVMVKYFKYLGEDGLHPDQSRPKRHI